MLNKKQLVSAIVEECLLDENSVREVLDAFVRVADRETKTGGGISLPGFGKMWAKETPKRSVRNPKTGLWMDRGPDLSLRFQPSAKLKRGLNPKSE